MDGTRTTVVVDGLCGSGSSGELTTRHGPASRDRMDDVSLAPAPSRMLASSLVRRDECLEELEVDESGEGDGDRDEERGDEEESDE
mmetsp:Transcript_11018/g.34965  ORF Transcript_11018/g.34965 Transcript_11018/m.34965 type:complete len:86 (+) Transcript_11018:2635-2892(+)